MTLEKLEELRITYENKKRQIKKNIIITSILIALLAFVIWRNFFYLIGALYSGFIMVIVLPDFFASKEGRAYNEAYKLLFVLNGLKDIFTNLTYEPHRGMPYETIANTHMIIMGNRYSSNDFISGNYKDVFFSQADVHIQEETEYTDSDGNTQTEYATIFKGRWMTFDFNKTFKANIQVCQKGFLNSKVKKKDKSVKEDDNTYFKKINMDDEEFNNRFNVYAQNEEDAFYILTPSLMEKIKKIADENEEKFILCFVDNRLEIGLTSNEDSFEAPDSSKRIDAQKEIEKTNKNIKIITQFIDGLNLDNTLFKKNINNVQPNMVTLNNPMGYTGQPNTKPINKNNSL